MKKSKTEKLVKAAFTTPPPAKKTKRKFKIGDKVRVRDYNPINGRRENPYFSLKEKSLVAKRVSEANETVTKPL